MFQSQTDRPRPRRLPNHRWNIYPERPELLSSLVRATGLSPTLVRVLINRGIETPEQARIFLEPDSMVLPDPMEEFADLGKSVALLGDCIAEGRKIAICGDYDADGMTSTALLLRSLRFLGARVDYAIPSRMTEGYGINSRIVEEFHREGVKLILTVDNGIAAVKPIALARQLGLDVIVTDHHEVPEEIPPATAILNPKLIREDSPYRGIAGVGVAYILAVSLADRLAKASQLIAPMRELLTLGTIADLAPLTGVNRRWVKLGLRQLPESKIPGVQALIQISGASYSPVAKQPFTVNSATAQNNPSNNPQNAAQNLQNNAKKNWSKAQKTMKPDEIGFRLGPRINAVGRIGDPQTVISLLTTDDMGLALERAMQCEETNKRRQLLCEEIQNEAIALIEESQIDLLEERVLVIVQPDWHHGTIGIVASRLVERYGVPVFIGTYEDEEKQHIRGSARGIPEFHVFEALQFCDDLLDKYGGHRAAGGFSLSAEFLSDFRASLRIFARRCLEVSHLKPVISIDALVPLPEISLEFYRQTDIFQPCGIENRPPVFWSANVKVVEQRIVGKGHVKLTLASGYGAMVSGEVPFEIKAIAWRWGDYFPLPPVIDIAYKLRENTWNGNTTVELELVSARLPKQSSSYSLAGNNPAIAREAKTFTVSRRKDISLLLPEPPPVRGQPEWLSGIPLERLLPFLRGRVLAYGADRPFPISRKPGANGGQKDWSCQIECDRPTGPCEAFLLWTLPPSITHLRWLLAKGKPRQVYKYDRLPTLVAPEQLRSLLEKHLQEFPAQPLNLLRLGQKWWVAPRTLIAALRELGYPCHGFPESDSLDRELERLHRWYAYPPAKLAQIHW